MLIIKQSTNKLRELPKNYSHILLIIKHQQRKDFEIKILYRHYQTLIINQQIKLIEQKIKMSKSLSSSKYKNQIREASGIIPSYAMDTKKSSSKTQISSNDDQIRSFQIGIQTVAPLLSRLDEQNMELKYQKQFICQEMKLIDQVSAHLLQENKDLILHYQRRADDLSNLVKSIMVNCNQNQNDLTQSIFYYQNSNAIIVRNIQKIMAQNKQLNQENSRISNHLADQAQRKTLKSQNLERSILKNRLSQTQIPSLESHISRFTLSKIDYEINELIFQVNRLQKKKKKMIQMKNEAMKIDINNPQAVNQYIKEPIKKMNILKGEVYNLKTSLEQHLLPKQQRIFINLQKIKKKQNESELDWNNKVFKLNYLNQQCKSMKSKFIPHYMDKLQRQKDKQEKLGYQVNKLKIKLGNIKLIASKKRQQREARVQKIILQSQDRIRSLKNKIHQEKCKNSGLLLREFRTIEEKIMHLQNRQRQFQQEIQYLQECISKQKNPIGEIMALEHTLSKKSTNYY